MTLAPKLLFTAAIGLLALIGGRPALADPIFDTAGTFSVVGVNAPNSFTTLGISAAPGTSLIDGGLLKMTESIIPIGGGNEWITWLFQTTNGKPIAGDINADWSLRVAAFPLTGTFVLKHFFNDWGTGGLLTDPTAAIGSNNPLETNPITGLGIVFGQPLSLPTTLAGGTSAADTFSGFLTPNGFDPTKVDTFEVGELFGVPEPTSLALFGAGLLGFAALRRRKRD